jgi:hypothetical protein
MGISAILPRMASPVLKTFLTLSVVNFPHTLVKSDLSVILISPADPTRIRPLNIVEVGNTNGN